MRSIDEQTKHLKQDINKAKVFRDWSKVIAAFIVFNGVAVAFSFYLYLQIETGNIFVADDDQADDGITLFDLDVLASTTNAYDAKQKNFDVLINSSSAAPLIN